MWFVLAVIVTSVAMAMTWKRYVDPKTRGLNVNAFTLALAKFFGLALVAAFVLTFATDAVVIVPAGQRGVVFDNFKGVKPVPLKEGWNFIVPFVQKATLVNVRVQAWVIEDASAASKDLQVVHATVTVNVYPIRNEVAKLYQEVGLDYANRIIGPAVQEVLKASTARYTAEELITRREAVKKDIHEGLAKVLIRAHIQLVETYITHFQFSQEFAKAIEEKQVAEQQALRAQRELVRVKIEAEQKIATARAVAQSMMMQREAASGPLVELRRIEMQNEAIAVWDGKMPRMLLGRTVPMLDVSKLAPAP